MGLDVKVGAFSAGVGALASTQTITVGFEPKVVLFWWSGRTETTDAAGVASHFRGFGVATGTASRRVTMSVSITGGAASDAGNHHRADAVIMSTTASGSTMDGAIDLDAFLATGFRLIVDDVMPRDTRVHYLALGGTDITNATTGQFQEPAATGTVDYTTVGFQPDVVIFLATRGQSAPPSGGGDSNQMIGVAVGTGATDQAIWLGGANDASATPQAVDYCRLGDCVANLNSAVTAVDARASFSSFLSNGFQLNWALRTTALRYFHFLAIKGGRWKVGSLTTSTGTSNFTETGVGFLPQAALFVSHCNTESVAATNQNPDQLSLGAATSATERGAIGVLDENAPASGNAEVETAQEHDEVYVNLDATGAVQGLMDLVSFDSDGMTLVMDDADPTSRFVWYLAVAGAAGAAAKSPPPFSRPLRVWSRRY